MRKVLVLFFVFGFLALGFVIWKFLDFRSGTISPQREVIFLVAPGETFKSVSARLVEQELIPNGLWFEIFGRLLGVDSKIRTGEYQLPASYTQEGLLQILTSGKSIEYVLTVQEGLNRFEIAALYEQLKLGSAQDFLKATENPQLIQSLLHEDLPSLEGYLFPETYRLTRFTSIESLLRMMVHTFLTNYNEVAGQARVKMPRHEAVILASIVEKETGSREDRTKVASVFHNRLAKHMPLQTDPTILYGILMETGQFSKNIKKADILKPNKYNTYTFVGLPIGPISNPGKESLQATLNPANTPFLFFVSKNDGTTQFSTTLKDHSSAVKTFQKDAKARQGKSWRDLKKKPQNKKAI